MVFSFTGYVHNHVTISIIIFCSDSEMPDDLTLGQISCQTKSRIFSASPVVAVVYCALH